MARVIVLPYSNKHEKKPVIKVSCGVQQDIIGRKNRTENRLLNNALGGSLEARDLNTPSDINEIGRVWTF